MASSLLILPLALPHLRTQFAVFVPAQDDGFQAEQVLCDVAMRRTRLRGIERLQGAQVQQRGAGDWPCRIDLQRMAFQGLRLCIEGVELATKARRQRHGAHVGSAVSQGTR